MKDHTIGDLDNRQLLIRTYGPFQFQSFRGGDWRFRPLLLLNPLRWIRAIMERNNWGFWVRKNPYMTHRCYCPTGSSIDGRIVVCGFGLSFWYSRFTGGIPCACDKMIATLLEEVEE